MRIIIEQAKIGDVAIIAGILREAAEWLESKNIPLWQSGWITPEKIAPDVESGMYWLAKIEGETVGCVRFQNSDEEYWNDVPHADSAFIHRLAIRRTFANRGVSTGLIEWAKGKARRAGKTYLRLDCADRPKLRRVYENQGFAFHSIKHKEPYPVARFEFDLKSFER